MKFKPRLIVGNVNVSTQKPVNIFVNLLVSLLVVCLCVYITLTLYVEALIYFVPEKVSHVFETFISKKVFTPDKYLADRDTIQAHLNQLVDNNDYHVHIIESTQKNAFAFPGRQIAITDALLREIKTENELSMLLGHEVGHYIYNDHLRALGKATIVMGMMTVINIGGGADVSGLAASSLNLFDLQYSRSEEERADAYGLQLINNYYGHVTGSISLFEILKDEISERWTLQGLLSTHPLSDQRIKNMHALALANKYIFKNKESLPVFDFNFPPPVDE